MTNVKVFVTSIPKSAFECPFYQTGDSYPGHYCHLRGGADCLLKTQQSCDKLECCLTR